MKFVESANLPNSAKCILIGEKYAEKLRIPLENRGIELIPVPDNPCVDERVSGHADLSVLHLGGGELVLAPYLKESTFSRKLKERGFNISFSEIEQENKYPYDSALNLCLCGNRLICRPKSAENKIVEYLTKERGFELLPVEQGYTKCSVCIVNENAIITSDAGIHDRAVAAGMDLLKIAPGYIDLPGFEYGFIGGASFKLSKNELAFTGNLDDHPDKERILNFTSLHNIKIVYITNMRAFDIGSGIQIVENDA